MARYKVNRRKDRKMFGRTAATTKRVNLNFSQRGGIRF